MKSQFALSFLIVLLIASSARAGFIEIGASGSYRRANIDTDAYDESQSITGSLSYYFDESSAIELSYTDGQNKRAISEGLPNGHVTNMTYTLLGLDFVYTFGSRESDFRPYVKAGANYILDKRIVDQYRDSSGNLFPATVVEDEPALVPSAGIGARIGLTKNLSLKIGVDGWSSRPISKQPMTIDYAGRVGLSFMF